jgi:hypothetical protein
MLSVRQNQMMMVVMDITVSIRSSYFGCGKGFPDYLSPKARKGEFTTGPRPQSAQECHCHL